MDDVQNGQWVRVDDVETWDFVFSCETWIVIGGMICGGDEYCFETSEMVCEDVVVVQLV